MSRNEMEWTVDYGDGPTPCQIPHAWKQDVDIRWEGPAKYCASIAADTAHQWIVFRGVSYQARVYFDGHLVCVHNGIWDAFAVPMPQKKGKHVEITVEVTKNGGQTFPVRDVLSGFLPYVFQTFGGIFREVEVITSVENPLKGGGSAPESRIAIEGNKLLLDGEAWFMRGVLSWGWYPESGCPNPDSETIRKEVQRVKRLGFNLVKFCLWLPPHRYLEILEEEELVAWVELPLWMPGANMDLELALQEVENIVSQYRHHSSIVCWTCGCELSEGTPHTFRQQLVNKVQELTGCPLVRDNSGGAEMYGGDLREYGTFFDYHPYCDTQFYPTVLQDLLNGPRPAMPIFLGETNDYDLYRTLSMLKESQPYWASPDPYLNDIGVRWQYDLPDVLQDDSRLLPREIELVLEEASQSKSGWIREAVTRHIVQFDDIAGYVITGLSETPISSSGVLENTALEGIFDQDTFFIIPTRNPKWVNGGNRPGWQCTNHFFPGAQTIKLGARSTKGFSGSIQLEWTSEESQSTEEIQISLPPNQPQQIVAITQNFKPDQHQTLSIGHGDSTYFEFMCYNRFDWNEHPNWKYTSKNGLLPQHTGNGEFEVEFGSNRVPEKGILFLEDEHTLSFPFWRECITWNTSGLVELDNWDFLLPVCSDKVIDSEWLAQQGPNMELLLTRVDTRTYERHPYVVRIGQIVVTTLRPWGGLGIQPTAFESNPAGHQLMRLLVKLAECR